MEYSHLYKRIKRVNFDNRAKEWDKLDRRVVLARNVAKAIYESIPLDNKMKIVDMGAGTGLLLRELLPYTGKAIAIDTSAEMLKELRSKVPKDADVDTIQSDIIDITLNDIDLIVSSMTIHHIKSLETLFKKLYSFLKNGGYIAIADLMPEDGSFHSHGNEGVYHFGFEKERLIDICKKARFCDIDYKKVHTVTKSSGEYGIFLLTAKKY